MASDKRSRKKVTGGRQQKVFRLLLCSLFFCYLCITFFASGEHKLLYTMTANKDNTPHTSSTWTEVGYSPLCSNQFLTTPVFLPGETTFFLCREDGGRRPVKLTFVVFKAPDAEEWEDDAVVGEMLVQALGDGDEEVEPVRVVNLGMPPAEFIRLVNQTDDATVFNISWPYGEVEVEKATVTDEGYLFRKEDFEAEKGIRCRLTPYNGHPFTLTLKIPFAGFSLRNADGNAVSGEMEVPYDDVTRYTYAFTGSEANDRFSVLLDDGRLNYLCVQRENGRLAVRDLRNKLAVVDEIGAEGPLSQLLMGAHTALVKNRNNRWRISLAGSLPASEPVPECEPTALVRYAFGRLMAEESEGENDLLKQLMQLEAHLGFQWFWLKETDWSFEHLDGLLDMADLDDNPEKMMRQALLYNRFERFMHKLTACSYSAMKPIQGDRLQARNNKRKIARCVKRIANHRSDAGSSIVTPPNSYQDDADDNFPNDAGSSLWALAEADRREILTLFSTFHRDFIEALGA